MLPQARGRQPAALEGQVWLMFVGFCVVRMSQCIGCLKNQDSRVFQHVPMHLYKVLNDLNVSFSTEVAFTLLSSGVGKQNGAALTSSGKIGS